VAHRVNNFAADIGKRLPIVVTHHEEAGRSSTDHGDGKRRIVIANRAMSALGQKQTSRSEISMSALPPKADIRQREWDVRFVPIAD
jgi:hypothetical protein